MNIEPKPVKEYSVPSLEKAFNLFDLLIAADRPLSLSVLAKKLGESPSGIFRILNQMVLRGYIFRETDSGGYSISPLGKLISPVEQLKLVSIPIIENFLQEASFSCHLSILSGNNQLIIYNGFSKKNFLQITVGTGRVVNALETHTGQFMLSRWSDKKLKSFFYGQTKEAESLYSKQIKNLRNEKVIMRSSLAIEGTADVIAIGPLNSRKLIWAISCPIIKKNLKPSQLEKEIIPEVGQLAEAIGEQFK